MPWSCSSLCLPSPCSSECAPDSGYAAASAVTPPEVAQEEPSWAPHCFPRGGHSDGTFPNTLPNPPPPSPSGASLPSPILWGQVPGWASSPPPPSTAATKSLQQLPSPSKDVMADGGLHQGRGGIFGHASPWRGCWRLRPGGAECGGSGLSVQAAQ